VPPDLTGARLLLAGSRAARWGSVGFGVLTTGALGAMFSVDPGSGAERIAGYVAAVFVGGLVGLGLVGPTCSQVWVSDEALIVRAGPRRWRQVPWSEVRAGTWLHRRWVWSPAITTRTGRASERPNPSLFTPLCRIVLTGGWQTGARALRAEFERRGVPWTYDSPGMRIAPSWNSDRWDC
jgi:hypothetical protein